MDTSDIFATEMPVLLRINYQRQDVIFQVLTDKPSLKSELEVFLGGQNYLFVKSGNQWSLAEKHATEDLDLGLMDEVSRALALRFRISSSQHVNQ
ncbi:hypothetical protein [Pelobium manganitolerans]|nr:hypothetical protein [Pelobium manganitolerans]